MTFWQFFSNIDLFRKPLLLRVVKEDTVSTNFGIFLSFIIYSCLIYFFSQSDFFLKLNPTIVIENSQLNLAPPILYQNKTFSFAVKDVTGKSVMDPSYFYVTIDVVTISLNSMGIPNLNYEPKTYHSCNESDAQNTLEFIILVDTYCLDNSTFTLAGSLGDVYNSFLQIQLYMCQNSSENNNSCKSVDEIDSYFNMKSLNLNYKNTIFQLKSYDSPMVDSFISSVYKLEAKLNRLVTINIEKAYIETDETIIKTKINIIETFVYENEQSEIGLSISNDDPIISVVFFSSRDVMTSHRSYQTLTAVFGTLGGLFSLLLILGNTINKLENSVNLTIILMNFLYSFQQPELNDQNQKNNSLNTKLHVYKKNNKKSEASPQQNKIELGFSEDKFRNDPLLNENLDPPKNKKRKNIKLKFEKRQKNILHEETSIPTSRPLDNKSKNPTSGMQRTKNLENPHINIECLTSSLKTTQIQESIPMSSPKPLQSPTSKLSNFLKKLNFVKTPKEEQLKSLDEFVRISEKKTQISFSFFGFLKLLMKKFGRISLDFKEKLFIRTQQVFEDEIDIVKILKRIQDIEKLKYLLLNDQQMMLFDVLEKPMIFVENQKEHHALASFVLSPNRKKLNVDLKIRKAFDFYQELEKKSSRDPIDEKLFLLIDKRFQTYKKYAKTN